MKPKKCQKEYTTLRLLWKFLRGSKRYFVLTILAAFGMTLTEMVSPQIVKFTVDSVIGKEPIALPDFVVRQIEKVGGVAAVRTHLWWVAIAVVISAAVATVFRYAFRVYNSKSSETLVETMRNTIFHQISQLPFSWHTKNQTGDIIQRCTSDVEMVRNFISEQLTQVLRIVVLLIFSISFMAGINGKLTLIAVAMLPIIVLYSAFFHKQIGSGFRAADEKEGVLSAIAQENLTGVRVVRAFGRESYERQRFEKCDAEYSTLWMKLCWKLSTFWTTSDLISGIAKMLIITFGAVFCVRKEMTPGAYIAFLSYYGMLTWPVRQLGRMISEMSKAGVSIERIKYIMNSKVEQDSADALRPPMNGDIVFDDVSFTYNGNRQHLDHVSFTIPAGSTVGILGSTGSGKSTLTCLLDRLYDIAPGNGKITIGGVDIAQIDRQYLRKNIGIVLQEPYLFSRTIKENISLGQTLDDEQLQSAVDAACLSESIENFADRYDTFVGERGVTLSGGQKQRAAIARMLANPCPITVLDDSLSAVDTETDARIRAALKEKLTGSTVLLVSHRITTLMNADYIVVLKRGKIIETGTHAELIYGGGVYQQIYEMQSKGVDEIE